MMTMMKGVGGQGCVDLQMLNSQGSVAVTVIGFAFNAFSMTRTPYVTHVRTALVPKACYLTSSTAPKLSSATARLLAACHVHLSAPSQNNQR